MADFASRIIERKLAVLLIYNFCRIAPGDTATKNLNSVLRLWYGRDDERLSFDELMRRKDTKPIDPKLFDRHLFELGRRQFIRWLNDLTSMRLLVKDVDSSRNTWYAKTEKGKRQSFASFLKDWVEREEVGECRDLYGASIIYSEPALDSFMREEDFEDLYHIMNEANAQIAGKILDALVKSKLGELSDRDRQNAVFYRENISEFDRMARRFEKAGVAKTLNEDRKVNSEMLRQAKTRGFGSIEELKNADCYRFTDPFKDYSLTLAEQEKHRYLKSRIRPKDERFFAKVEEEMPGVFSCFYNFEMEELFLSNYNLILTANDVIKPLGEVLDSLGHDQLKEYVERIGKALRSPLGKLPEWVGSKGDQPKMRLSWGNKTRRKYLLRIHVNVERKLWRSSAISPSDC